MLRYPGDWTVICCSIPEADPIRAYKFFDACAVLGATGRLVPMQEREIVQGLRHIDLKPFDTIVTHNEVGEYGHPHHRMLHKVLVRRFADKPIVTFGARREGMGEHVLRLTKAEAAKKMEALRCYNHVALIDGAKHRKWRKILEYRQKNGYQVNTESYDRHRPGS